eukprot:342217_1
MAAYDAPYQTKTTNTVKDPELQRFIDIAKRGQTFRVYKMSKIKQIHKSKLVYEDEKSTLKIIFASDNRPIRLKWGGKWASGGVDFSRIHKIEWGVKEGRFSQLKNHFGLKFTAGLCFSVMWRVNYDEDTTDFEAPDKHVAILWIKGLRMLIGQKTDEFDEFNYGYGNKDSALNNPQYNGYRFNTSNAYVAPNNMGMTQNKYKPYKGAKKEQKQKFVKRFNEIWDNIVTLFQWDKTVKRQQKKQVNVHKMYKKAIQYNISNVNIWEQGEFIRTEIANALQLNIPQSVSAINTNHSVTTQCIQYQQPYKPHNNDVNDMSSMMAAMFFGQVPIQIPSSDHENNGNDKVQEQ